MNCAPTRFRPALYAIAVTVMATAAAAQGRGGSTVIVEPVREELTADRVMVTGNVMAIHRSNVATREPGLVLQVAVDEGHVVAAGDVLAQLDDSKLRILLSEAEAQNRVDKAMEDQRTALLERAKRDEKLVRESFERGAANPRELLNAETDVQTAQAALEQAKQQVVVSAARADLLRTRLDDMKITAPFDGVVVTKHTEWGQWISEGDAVVELISTGAVETWLDVPQRYLLQARLLEQSSVKLIIESPATTVEGELDRLIPQVHPSARMFRLVAHVENETGDLAPGMSVTGWLPTSERSPRLTVHKDAVLRNDAGAFVYVVRPGRDGESPQAAPVQVRVLYPEGARYVIESAGLSAGDDVIIEGNERLFPYSAVQPIRPESAGDEQQDGTGE